MISLNKKLIILMVIIIAVVLGISIAIIKNNAKIENVKPDKSLANSNVENNKIISDNSKNIVENNSIKDDNNSNAIVTLNNSNSSEDNNTDKKENINNSKNNTKISSTNKEVSGQTSVVPSTISTEDIEKIENGNSHTFIGTITNINNEAIIIKPDDGYEGVSGNEITLKKSEYGSGLKVNDRLEITFTGEITKTYPGNIHVVKITKL